MKNFLPYPYQKRAILHTFNNPFCGLFLDMGLGKTIITLSAIVHLLVSFKVRKVLIIAPLRVANNVWKQEAEKWRITSWLRFSICTGSSDKREKALNTEASIYVINRENVKWLCDYYKGKLPFDMCVIDELSSFKNHKAQRFLALKKVRHCFSRVVGLTGTPVGNGYMDLWSELYLLDGGERLLPYISRYREAYFTENRVCGNEHAFGYELREGMDNVINTKIADICLSMKTEDYLTLPELIVVDEIVKLSPDVLASYKKFEKDKIIEILSTEITADSAVVLTNKLLQYTNGAVYYDERGYVTVHDTKLERLLTLLERANGQPVLVAYQYKHDIARILPAVKKAFPHYDVRVLKTDKDITDWNLGKINVMFAQPKSAGIGLNLQFGGNIIIWFGLTWSLELYLQFLKRIHRQGITKPVFCYRIIAENTYDEIVVAALNEKKIVQDKLMEQIKFYQEHFNKTKLC